MNTAAESSHEADCRDRLIAAAIELFAERGFEGSSIRAITAAADCGVAGVNYHFGGKEKLYEEAFRSLFSEIQERRMAAVRASLQADPEMELEGFLRSFSTAFLEPLVSGGRGALFIAFFAREMSDRRMAPAIFLDEFVRPFMALSVEALTRCGPPMDEATKILSLMSVVGQLIHIVRVIHMDELGELRLPVADVDSFVDHIVRFSAAGIRACAAPAGDGGHNQEIGA